MKELFPGIFENHGKLCTRNLVPGKRIYGEKLFHENGFEYRIWNSFRSKLSGAIRNKLEDVPLQAGSTVLYLGISEGTTAGHISDIIGLEGVIFGIDVSEQTMKKLIGICETRTNIIPILADANQPENYKEYLEGFEVDLIYMDVSQKNQVEILQKNAGCYLSKNGKAMLCLKLKSISSTQPIQEIIDNAELELKQHFKILQVLDLKPFDKDHRFYLLEKKG